MPTHIPPETLAEVITKWREREAYWRGFAERVPQTDKVSIAEAMGRGLVYGFCAEQLESQQVAALAQSSTQAAGVQEWRPVGEGFCYGFGCKKAHPSPQGQDQEERKP